MKDAGSCFGGRAIADEPRQKRAVEVRSPAAIPLPCGAVRTTLAPIRVAPLFAHQHGRACFGAGTPLLHKWARSRGRARCAEPGEVASSARIGLENRLYQSEIALLAGLSLADG